MTPRTHLRYPGQGGRGGEVRAVLVLFALLDSRFPSGQPRDGSAGNAAGEGCGLGVCAVLAGTFWESGGGGWWRAEGRFAKAPTLCLLCPGCLLVGSTVSCSSAASGSLGSRP